MTHQLSIQICKMSWHQHNCYNTDSFNTGNEYWHYLSYATFSTVFVLTTIFTKTVIMYMSPNDSSIIHCPSRYAKCHGTSMTGFTLYDWWTIKAHVHLWHFCKTAGKAFCTVFTLTTLDDVIPVSFHPRYPLQVQSLSLFLPFSQKTVIMYTSPNSSSIICCPAKCHGTTMTGITGFTTYDQWTIESHKQ